MMIRVKNLYSAYRWVNDIIVEVSEMFLNKKKCQIICAVKNSINN